MIMNRDRYTNAVLTVIAGCLLFQCALLLGTRVEAQSPAAKADRAQPVVIVGWGEISAGGQIHLHVPQTPLPVTIAAPQPLPIALPTAPQPIPVAITGIHNAFGQWDPINTRLEPQPPAALPGYPPGYPPR
jgi:hypothetical protein